MSIFLTRFPGDFRLQAESENVGLCFAAALVDESKVHGATMGIS